jgi:hypothetical protein
MAIRLGAAALIGYMVAFMKTHHRCCYQAIALIDLLVGFVCEVIAFLFTPTQDPCLVQQSPLLSFFPVELFPLCDWNFSSSVASSASGKAILKYSCRMAKQALVFRTFCANIESSFGLV